MSKIPDGAVSSGWKKPTESSSFVQQILSGGSSPMAILKNLFADRYTVPSSMSEESAMQLLMEMFFNGRRTREKLPQHNTFQDAVALLRYYLGLSLPIVFA